MELLLHQIHYVSFQITDEALMLMCGNIGCYPFQDKDQFIIEECPHVYFVGNQPAFETAIVDGPTGQSVRLITIPKFKETGEMVLLDMDTLEVEAVKFEVFNDT